MAKTSMSQRKTMGRVMHEYAHGELKSGPRGQQRSGGGKVKSRRQAIAIALEEAGASQYESKGKNRRKPARTKAKEATGRTAQQGRWRTYDEGLPAGQRCPPLPGVATVTVSSSMGSP